MEKENAANCYFRLNYGSPFRTGQGTEIILRELQENAVEGTWLDLGCGSNSFFWRSAMPNNLKLTGVDYDADTLELAKDLQRSGYRQGAFEYAHNHFSSLSWKEYYDISSQFLRMDLLNGNLDELPMADMVTEFGLLGLCKNKTHFGQRLMSFLHHVNVNGLLIGANWIFSDKKSREYGFTNNYISEELIDSVSENESCKLIEFKQIRILNDPNYDEVDLFIIKK